MEEKPKVSDAQKKASKKYLDKNRDKINEQRKKYYNDRKANDPDFLKYKREKSKQYYDKYIKKPKKDINQIIDDKNIDNVNIDNRNILDIEIKF